MKSRLNRIALAQPAEHKHLLKTLRVKRDSENQGL